MNSMRDEQGEGQHNGGRRYQREAEGGGRTECGKASCRGGGVAESGRDEGIRLKNEPGTSGNSGGGKYHFMPKGMTSCRKTIDLHIRLNGHREGSEKLGT